MMNCMRMSPWPWPVHHSLLWRGGAAAEERVPLPLQRQVAAVGALRAAVLLYGWAHQRGGIPAGQRCIGQAAGLGMYVMYVRIYVWLYVYNSSKRTPRTQSPSIKEYVCIVVCNHCICAVLLSIMNVLYDVINESLRYIDVGTSFSSYEEVLYYYTYSIYKYTMYYISMVYIITRMPGPLRIRICVSRITSATWPLLSKVWYWGCIFSSC